MNPAIKEIRVEEVRKHFGQQAALRGLSCVLKTGEVSLLAGPNGAGKSTLLSILATLSRATSGRVLYDSVEQQQFAQMGRRQIGYVGHASMLYRELSCRENLLFFSRLYGVADAAASVDKWLEKVGLTEAADRQVRKLSRGMTQRLTLARALLAEPDLLFFDEPFTGLDAQGQQLLQELLKQFAKEGALVVIIAHDLDPLDQLVDHLLLLRAGHLVKDVKQPAMSASSLKEALHGD